VTAAWRAEYSEALLHMAEASAPDRLLQPFPLAAGFLALYQCFKPIPAASCCNAPGRIGLTTLLPSDAHLLDSLCPMIATDDQLVRRCQHRRAQARVLLPFSWNTAQRALTVQRPPNTHLAWHCPSGPAPFANKYAKESFRSCASGHGTWGRRITGHLKCVALVVADLLSLRPGDTVLDWGSGCGWTLSWLCSLYGAHGYGIDATASNVAWSRRFSAGDVCLWSGMNLSWVPDSSFDAVISYWALYHLNTSDQCNIARQLVRKLKPGGRAWFGGNMPSPALNIANVPFSRGQWLRCLGADSTVGRGLRPLRVDFAEDLTLFRSTTEQLGICGGDYLFWSPTYSTLVTRLMA